MSKNECIFIRFNKRITKVINKYGYISLDGIIRFQYYYTNFNTMDLHLLNVRVKNKSF
jgi:hypothetical protein